MLMSSQYLYGKYSCWSIIANTDLMEHVLVPPLSPNHMFPIAALFQILASSHSGRVRCPAQWAQAAAEHRQLLTPATQLQSRGKEELAGDVDKILVLQMQF